LRKKRRQGDVFILEGAEKGRNNPKGVTVKLTKTPALAVAVTAAIAGTAGVTASAYGASHHHQKRHHHHSSVSIPQHNGGDRDADNNGGPSDGDGNV
jgi:hypothetical protein